VRIAVVRLNKKNTKQLCSKSTMADCKVYWEFVRMCYHMHEVIEVS